MVRAKFRVHHIDPVGPVIKMSPVYSGSEENKSFFASTPGGSIDLYTVNPEAAKQFESGREYYVDFTPA
jgi:hypothetical protein